MAKKTPATEAEAPQKKGGKLVLILGIVTVLAGAGGGGAWYFMRGADPNAAAAPSAKPAVFLPLESFTVNLVGPEGAPQYLQAGLTLKLAAHVKQDVVKERMPEIRNRVLLVLSGKKAADLLPVAGKNRLALELADAVAEVAGPNAAIKPRTAAPVVVAAAPTSAAPTAADAAKAPLPAAPVAAVGASDVEVLFTSFIIQ